MTHGLLSTYELLLARFGPRHWWPSDSPLETAVGAILTQNTAWRNVEQAIGRLKNAGLLSARSLGEASVERVSELVRPAGYYRQKARYVKAFAAFLVEAYDGDLANMGRAGTEEVRAQLLGVLGIGPETADSILLYALGRPVFVIDGYTRRIVARLGIREDALGMPYGKLQGFFESHLPRSAALYNEYHALLVSLGKEYCRKRPQCGGCPVRGGCVRQSVRASENAS